MENEVTMSKVYEAGCLALGLVLVGYVPEAAAVKICQWKPI
jgi:hypothetical protein